MSRPTLSKFKFSSGYLLDIYFFFLLDIYFLYHIWQFVSELIEYGCINTWIQGIDSTEITLLPESKNMMNMVHNFSHRLSWVQWKFTTPDQFTLLIKILHFFGHWSLYLFQSDHCFQAIRFVDRPFPEKLNIFHINLS